MRGYKPSQHITGVAPTDIQAASGGGGQMWGLDHVRVQKSWSLPTLRLGGLRPSVAVEIILPIAGICPWWSLPQALSRCFRTLTIVLGTQIFLCVVLVFLPAPLCVDEVGWGRVGNDFHRALCQLTHLNSEAAENSETHLLPILCRESAPSSPSLPLHPSIPSTSLLFSFCPPFFLSLRESSTEV